MASRTTVARTTENRITAAQITGAQTTGSNNGTVAEKWLPEFVGINASWETALGQSNDALYDAQFDSGLGSSPLLTVVDATAESITPVHGANVLKMGVDGERDRFIREHNAFTPEGDCRYTRMYQQVVCIDEDVSQIHHFEDFPSPESAGSTRFVHRLYGYQANDGRWSVSPQSYSDQSTPFDACPNQATDGPYGQQPFIQGLTALVNNDAMNPEEHDPEGLECGKWYRIESQECCAEQGANCWDTPNHETSIPVIMRVRVWDQNGLVQGDDKHFTKHHGGNYSRRSMEDIYAAGACWIVQSSTLFGIGNNGQQGLTATADALMYWDAVVTGSSDDYRVGAESWIGPCDGPGCF